MRDLPHMIDLGGVRLRPRERAIVGATGEVSVEPLAMKFLIALCRRAGRTVDRGVLFQSCWGDLPVGDDSLNRVAAAVRKALRQAGAEAVHIETVPTAGYGLRFSLAPFSSKQLVTAEVASAKRASVESWRAGLPQPDLVAIERLRRAAAIAPDDASARGMLAILLRHAAEYADIEDRDEFVADCERSAAEALQLDPRQPEAHVAIASLIPLLGNWSAAYDRLSELRAENPDNAVAAHDLAIVEMATGRVVEAKAIMDHLITAHQLAPIFAYKSTYQNWSLGDLDTMDRRADAAIQLWPYHPAIWTARFWTLAYTGRFPAALRLLEPASSAMPPAAIQLHRHLLDAVQSRSVRNLELSAERALTAASQGPAQAITGLFALGLIGDTDRAKAVIEAYYLHRGNAVPNNVSAEAPVNEMRRRLTQILFTPACANVRTSSWFSGLCGRIGLTEYWDVTGRQPDMSQTSTLRRGSA